jgi:hypothetical protein
MFDIETKIRLQVRLIEAWERHARIHWYKQGVKVFAAVVLVFVPRNRFACRRSIAGKHQLDGVLPSNRGQPQMATLNLGRNWPTVQFCRMQNAIAIVNQQVPVGLALE